MVGMIEWEGSEKDEQDNICICKIQPGRQIKLKVFGKTKEVQFQAGHKQSAAK